MFKLSSNCMPRQPMAFNSLRPINTGLNFNAYRGAFPSRQPRPLVETRTISSLTTPSLLRPTTSLFHRAVETGSIPKPKWNCSPFATSQILRHNYSFLHGKYLDPKNDLAFKKIFGEEKHKSIPINFLNAALALEGNDKIEDLEFLRERQAPEIESRKESLLDVLVRDKQGVKYIVEMQVAKEKGFEKRAQYYAAKTYIAHFKQGQKYYDLKKVVFLAITDFTLFPKKEGYKSDHVVLDKKSYEHDLRDFSFTFVELPKFTKSMDDLKTVEDRWYYFLKHADETKDIEALSANHPEIKEAYGVLDSFQWSESELERYENIIMYEARERGVLDAAKIDARIEEKNQIATILLKQGLSVNQIAEATGLSEEEILSLPK